MATFKRCDKSVSDMAARLMEEFDSHQSLVDNEVRIDFLFAYGDRDETTGGLISNALQKAGMKCLGITRKLPLKDRAKGLGDAEICLDGDYWEEADEPERRSLLDHELQHLVSTLDRDDLGRPIIKLRKHDVEVGWFKEVAARHGNHSQERIQAAKLMDTYGQFFWPGIVESRELSRFRKLETANT